MKRVLIALSAAALLLAPAAGATVRITSVNAVGFPTVRVTLVAPVGSKRPVLYENGIPTTSYTAVNLGGAKSIMLAVDRSESMRGRPLANALAAAEQFVGAAGPNDHVGVVAFGSTALALTPSASTPVDARDQLSGVNVDSRSGTALYDAIVLAANRLGHDARLGRAIVVVTDGADVSSTSSLADAVAAARAAHAAVYTIGIAGPDFTPDALRRIARDTGGSYRQAASTRELAATYTALEDELARTWQLSYLTSARAGDLITLGAVVPGAGRARTTVTLPATAGSTNLAPTGVIPSSGYGDTGTALIGAAVGGLILMSCLFWFASRRESRLRARLEPHLAAVVQTGKIRRRASRAATRARVVDAIENLFANVRQFRQIEQMIERANLPVRPGELIAISLGAGLGLGFIAALAGSAALLVIVFMAIGAFAPLAIVSYKARGRMRRFENQLPDLLITLAASLKAGHSFRQGIQSVVEEGAEPAADEFRRVLTETQLGKPIDDALTHMADRVGSKNFSFVITAVTIQRQIGGSLSGLFDMVAETVRQRQQFARKVKSLTAMGRMSAYVLVGLPFFLAGTISLLNSAYMAPLWHTGTGHAMVISGLVMIALGSLMLRKIASFRG